MGGRLCVGDGEGSIWRRDLNQIRVGAGFLDVRWLKDNICRKVGDGRFTLFWVDPRFDNVSFAMSFCMLFEFVDNKLAMVEMFLLGWEGDGEAWKWRMRLFAWEKGLVGECIDRFSSIVLQVGVADRCVWKLHSSQSYMVKSAYFYLTIDDSNDAKGFDHLLWLKAVPLKVNIFAWRLFLNRLATKDNLCRRRVLKASQNSYSALCGGMEDMDHLFFKCDY